MDDSIENGILSFNYDIKLGDIFYLKDLSNSYFKYKVVDNNCYGLRGQFELQIIGAHGKGVSAELLGSIRFRYTGPCDLSTRMRNEGKLFVTEEEYIMAGLK
jgi:hypothetical protein